MFAVLLLAATAAGAPAGLAVQTVEHRGARFTAVVIDLEHAELELFGQDPAAPPTSFAELRAKLAAEERELLLATNAGIYEPDRRPTGLHVERGRELAPLNPNKGAGNFFLKPNGVFYVGPDGAHVVDASAFSVATHDLKLATQSGPMLVMGGALHPAFRPKSKNKRLRSGVGVRADGKVVLAISEGQVRFHDFATLFRDALGCPDALYLDGAISRLEAPGRVAKEGAPPFGGILAVSRPRGPALPAPRGADDDHRPKR